MIPDWQSDDGRVELYRADFLNVMPTLAIKNIGAAVMDPPYGLGFPYRTYEDTRENLERLVSRFMPGIMMVAKRVVVLPGITQIHLYPTPDWTACVTWNTTGSFGAYGFTQWMPVLLYGQDVDGFARLPNRSLKSDVIRISGGEGVGFMRTGKPVEHPCPKPENLMREIVLRFTEDESTVCDGMMGSGTTGVACVQTGRRFIGVEIDPTYFDIAKRRIIAAQREVSERFDFAKPAARAEQLNLIG